jgi:hypothetical protein
VSNFVDSGRYSHLSREDAIELLERRAADRRLGLVWERDEIEHERALNDDFVALPVEAVAVAERFAAAPILAARAVQN